MATSALPVACAEARDGRTALGESLFTMRSSGEHVTHGVSSRSAGRHGVGDVPVEVDAEEKEQGRPRRGSSRRRGSQGAVPVNRADRGG